jgi:MinD superfamily P-loop ATPase
MVCINKYDINEEMSKKIEKFVEEKELVLVGKISYDDVVMESINELKPIIYYPDCKAIIDIKSMWKNIEMIIS